MYVGPCVFVGATETPVVVWHQQTVRSNLWRGDWGTQGRPGGRRGEGRKYVLVCRVLCVLYREAHSVPPTPGSPGLQLCVALSPLLFTPSPSLHPVCLSDWRRALLLTAFRLWKAKPVPCSVFVKAGAQVSLTQDQVAVRVIHKDTK